MIFLLLLFLVSAGLKESLQNNSSEEDSGPMWNNQSFIQTPHGNLTFEFIEQVENQTMITEDEELFLDQENKPQSHCFHKDLAQFMDYCESKFHQEMLQVGMDRWCHLENITRFYYELTSCVERSSVDYADCFYPNRHSQDFFLQVHDFYFSNCTQGEDVMLEDPPHWVVLVLTLIPVSLIPVLVYLVVWKSKVQE